MKKFFTISNSFFKGNEKENWESIKNQGYQGIVTTIENSIEEIEERKFRVIMSTSKENRNGYTILQNLDFSEFKKNPVLLNSHKDYDIRDIIGKVENIKKNKDGNYEGDTIFAKNPIGEEAYYLAKNGFLNAVSITIIPMEFDKDGKITKSKVLELSYVPIPADPDTLIQRNSVEEKTETKIEIKKEIKETERERVARILKNILDKRNENKKEALAILNRLKSDKVGSPVKMELNRILRVISKL